MYRRGLLIDIEECKTSNPREFWKYIKKLGPNKKQGIPWEVYDENGNICSDKTIVLDTWQREYCKLFNDTSGTFDEAFYRNVLESKAHIERNMLDPLYSDNRALNKALHIKEIEKAVLKAKNAKAVWMGFPMKF